MGVLLKVIPHRLSQWHQRETAFPNILPTFIQARFNLPTTLISANGCRLLSVCAHPNPTHSHSGMITEGYPVSYTPEGCAPVDHHTTDAFEVPASLVLSPTFETDSCRVAFNVAWHHTLRVYPQFQVLKWSRPLQPFVAIWPPDNFAQPIHRIHCRFKQT